MDDRELETRLRTHLHRTLDPAQPSPELRTSVLQVFATPVRRVGRFDLRGGVSRPSWELAAAALAVAVITITAATIGLNRGPAPGSQPSTQASTQATPLATGPAERSFVVIPPAGGTPSKAESSIASNVLTARLRALGFGNFSSGGGFAIVFQVPAGGPTDEATRRVLAATGNVEFVPLPAEDYFGEGGLQAEVGKPLPKDEPALFGWNGIESVAWGTDQQDRRTVNFTLTPTGRAAFADYTTSHVQEYVAIVVDGRVAALPVINEPIPGGEVQVSSGELAGSPGEATFAEWAAILIGGRLPESWRGVTSPEILTRDEAIAIAVARFSNLSVADSNLYVAMHGGQPRPIWSVDLKKTDASGCEGLVADDLAGCLGMATQVRIVATTGEVLTMQEWDDAGEPSPGP